jgi:hypothetical protein
MLLVVLDIRVPTLDLLPDPVGWFIDAVAAGSLSRSTGQLHPRAGRWFAATCAVCSVAVLPATLEWVGLDNAYVGYALEVGEGVVLFATCSAIMTALPGRRPTANLLRWLAVGSEAALLLLAGLATAEPDLGSLILLPGLVAVVAFLGFLVLLFKAAKDPVAVP